ncbi:prolyl oligopeptidase family serine peptidase [Duganella fentianensis]|uniref:S9 family peptidase n=1 Tax=Duganella fentianensis TaxID=2692177 RepID=UPI0032B1587B
MRLLVASLFSCVLVAGPSQAQAPSDTASKIPVEQFFQRPNTSGAAISPSGRQIALRRLSPQGRFMLTVVDTESKQARAVANFNNADVDLIFWISDERLVFTTNNVDHNGTIGKTGVYAMDRDGKNRILLRETVGHPRGFADGDQVRTDSQSGLSYNGFPATPDEELYVISTLPDSAEMARMDTRTGRVHNFRVPNNTFQLLIDADGKPRIATAWRQDLHQSFLRDGDSWREITRMGTPLTDGFKPLLFAEDQLYVRARNGRDEAGIYRYDIARQTLLPQPLITAPGFDTDGSFIVGPRNMLGFRFNTDAATTVWFDPAMKALQEQVDQQFPGLVNQISRGRFSSTPYVLISTHSDIQSHAFLLYHRDSKAVSLLGSAMPQLAPQQMSNMSLERFAARDGQQIPVLLTLPKHTGKAPFPTVVLNGASMAQRNGLWEWNPEVQFLASRGYAVLQVSPRGSNGFGLRHLNLTPAGSGTDALTDLADAVQWAAKQGYSDPARVCIAGGHGGGAAALRSLLTQAQTYQCAISWSAELKPKDDALNARLGELRKPVLLAYDKDSERLDYQQGRQLYATLQAQQAPVQWLEYPPQVEHWKTQQPRIDLWRQIESFLATHIGPRP